MVDVAEAAATLIAARKNNQLLDDLPDALKAESLEQAYAIQTEILATIGLAKVGWKVALTNDALQQRSGVTEPVCGPLYEPFVHQDGHVFEPTPCIGGIECEFAVRLAKGLPSADAPYTVEAAAEAVETLHPALEITGSRFKTRHQLGAKGSISDHSGNYGFIFGEGVADWRQFDLPSHAVRYVVNGEEVAADTGANVLGNPLKSIAWLANHLAKRGMELGAGDWISTGAVIGPIPAVPGAELLGDFGPLGQVTGTLPD